MDTLTGIVFGLFIIAQLGVIWECIRMKGTVTSSTTDLRTEMGNLGTLLDEALDYIADMPASPNSVAGQIGQLPVKEMLLQTFMERMMMGSEHGGTTQPENRQNDEVSTQVETENESN